MFSTVWADEASSISQFSMAREVFINFLVPSSKLAPAAVLKSTTVALFSEGCLSAPKDTSGVSLEKSIKTDVSEKATAATSSRAIPARKLSRFIYCSFRLFRLSRMPVINICRGPGFSNAFSPFSLFLLSIR